MANKYLLFSGATERLLGVYETELQALRDVAKGLAVHGPGSAQHLRLQREVPGEVDAIVAEGEELEVRAARAATQERRSA